MPSETIKDVALSDGRDPKKVASELREHLAERDASYSAETPSNAAALREALVRLDEHLHEDMYDCHLFFDLFDYDPKEEIADALAAPPRNCDAIPAGEMCRAFKHANCDQYENSSEDPRTCCEGRCVECVVKWMLGEYKEGDEEE